MNERKTPRALIAFAEPPTYQRFKKAWSKSTGISSFFGSDKDAFLEDWKAEKRSPLFEKRAIIKAKLMSDFEDKLPKLKNGFPTAKSRALIDNYEKEASRIAREKVPIKF